MDLDELLATMPFSVLTGMRIDAASADEVRGRLAWSPERCTAGGIMHGGAVMTLADSLGAVCAFMNLPPGAVTSTIESKTNFFRAVREGDVVAIGDAAARGPYDHRRADRCTRRRGPPGCADHPDAGRRTTGVRRTLRG